jgi:flavin reductase (DIM6/NTAB) family NADH-FMN oxidoreductase RutF
LRRSRRILQRYRRRTGTSSCARWWCPGLIALVTTLGPGGIVNAAPFSFFNVFAEAPPLIVLGLQSRPDGSLKDTSAHIRDIGSFTVNLVDEALAERMNICAVDFPPGTSEIDAAGLSGLPGISIRCRGSRRRRLP